MYFTNWCNYLDIAKDFYNSSVYNIYTNNEEFDDMYELYHCYISLIGEEMVGKRVSNIYYGENSNFWVDYLIEDFIKYNEAIVPNIIEEPLPPDIEATLDFNYGIPLTTKGELFNFITLGQLPNKESKKIPNNYAIRRNVN